MMKTALIGSLIILTASVADSFHTNFQQVFLQSIKGLDALKGTAAVGGNHCTVPFPDFNTAIIAKDETLNVLALVLTKKAGTDEEAAKKQLAGWEDQIAKLLPAGDYVRSQTYDADAAGYMKTIYDFNSSKMADKQKRPTLEMAVYFNQAEHEIVIRLIEPFFKNQYVPKMP